MDEEQGTNEATAETVAVAEQAAATPPPESGATLALPSRAEVEPIGAAAEATPEAGPPAQGAAPPPSYIYALGDVEPRFPSPGVEKEFAQATGRADAAGLTDRQALAALLDVPENRYLARLLCWVLKIAGLETYILVPRYPDDIEMLVGTLRAEPSAHDVDIVIGQRGPMAPPEVCNGLMVPLVAFDQIYSFDRDTLVKEIPQPDTLPDGISEEEFRASAAELLDRIIQVTDNAGATDEHRALNYLAVRYPAIYAKAAEEHHRNATLSGVEAHNSRLSGVRNIVNVVFSYTHRETGVRDQYFVRVDMSEEFPYLTSPLQQFFER